MKEIHEDVSAQVDGLFETKTKVFSTSEGKRVENYEMGARSVTESQCPKAPTRRSRSVPRRDSSWDKRWEDKRRTEERKHSREGTRPGRLNNSYWEEKSKEENSLPTKTPPPKRKLRDMMNGRITPIAR